MEYYEEFANFLVDEAKDYFLRGIAHIHVHQDKTVSVLPFVSNRAIVQFGPDSEASLALQKFLEKRVQQYCRNWDELIKRDDLSYEIFSLNYQEIKIIDDHEYTIKTILLIDIAEKAMIESDRRIAKKLSKRE